MNDADMIRNPSLWPGWPVLPLKKYNTPSDLVCGFVLDNALKGEIRLPIKVLKGNIFRITGNEPVRARCRRLVSRLAVKS